MATLKISVTDEDHIQGSSEAPITLVEYGDYECPYCGKIYPIIKELQKHYGHKLRFVFRNFPLNEMHPFAEVAAETAEFAGKRKLFWEMHDSLYENQAQLSGAFILELTESLGLSGKELEMALEKKTFLQKIREDFLGGVKSGVNGTPTLFINEARYNGPMDLEGLIEKIDSLLSSK